MPKMMESGRRKNRHDLPFSFVSTGSLISSSPCVPPAVSLRNPSSLKVTFLSVEMTLVLAVTLPFPDLRPFPVMSAVNHQVGASSSSHLRPLLLPFFSHMLNEHLRYLEFFKNLISDSGAAIFSADLNPVRFISRHECGSEC